MKSVYLSASGLILLSAATVHAQGIIMVTKTTTNGGDPKTNRVMVDKDHLRVETGAPGQGTVILFDGGSQTIRMVNVSNKTYSEMTKADMLRAQQAMGQMQERLQNLPPEQRARIEQMMRNRTGGAQPAQSAPVQYRDAGTDKVGKWTCTKYDGYEGEKKVKEICTVTAKEAGLSESDFDVVRQFAASMKSMMPAGMARMADASIADEQLRGIPVRTIVYENGAPTVTTEMVDIHHETFPAGTFEVPSGYQREGMMGGRRQR